VNSADPIAGSIRPAIVASLKLQKKADGVTGYALRLLRSIRSVLAPNGSSSNALAIVLMVTPGAC
jgi:hypothetical protein